MTDLVKVTGNAGGMTYNEGQDDVPLRMGRQGEAVVTQHHGKYYNQAVRGNLFYAANQAAQAVSVALATTYTGLCVSNPVGSGVNLSLLRVGIALQAAPAAIAPIGLIAGYSATANVTHTNALTPANLFLGGNTPLAKADDQATISTPVWIAQLVGGFTAAALFGTSPSLVDIDGAIVVPPGGFVCIGALTAVTGLFSMWWEEVPE